MKGKKLASVRINSLVSLIALFGISLFAVWLLPAAGATAAPADIGQCYDGSNPTQATYQLGHFVSNDDYNDSVEITVNGVPNIGWAYTWFSGNNPADVNGRQSITGTVPVSINDDSLLGGEIDSTVDFPTPGKYTLLVHGTGGPAGKRPITFSALPDDLTPITAGKGKIRVIHASGFDSDLDDLILDVKIGNSPFAEIDNLTYGSQGYFEVTPGTINLKAVDQSGKFVLFNMKPFTISDGELITLILYGDGVDKQMDIYSLSDCLNHYRYNQLAAAPQIPYPVGDVRFVNLAPSSSNLLAARLDLSLNGVIFPEFDDINYGEASGYKTLEPKTYTAQIFSPSSNVVKASVLLNIEDKKSYTLVATGGGSTSTPFKISVLEDDVTVPAPGKTTLRFGNFLSDGLVPSKLNVDSEDSPAIDFNNVAFGEVGMPDYEILDAADYDLKLVSGPQTLIDPQLTTLASGAVETLFAAGNGVEQPLGVFKITNSNGGVFVPLNSARLYVAHLAAFADTVAQTAVTLEIDGAVVPNFKEYGDSTGYLPLAAGNHSIVIKANGSPAATRSISLAAGKDYTMAFIGSLSNLSLTQPMLDDNTTVPSGNQTRVRVGHLAVLSGNPSIDMLEDTGTLASNVAFGSIGPNYISRAAGDLNIDVTLTGSLNPIINPDAISLAAGDSVTLLAAGGDSDIEAGLFAIVNGQKGFFIAPEPEKASLYFANLLALDPDLSKTAVSVQVGNDTVLTNVQFGESTDGYVGVPPGNQTIKIFDMTTSDLLLELAVSLEAQKPYQLIAHGNRAQRKLNLRSEPVSPGPGKIRLLAGNLVPEGSAFYGSVNVSQNGSPLATGLASGSLAADAVDIDTALISFTVKTSDDIVTLLESFEISLAPDSVITVLTAGDGGVNQPFGLYAIIDNLEMILLPTKEGSGQKSPKVVVSHFAPTGKGGATALRLRVNGVDVDSDFRFGEATDLIKGNSGINSIELIDPATNQVVETASSPSLQSGDTYFFFVTGGANEVDVQVVGYKDSAVTMPQKAVVTFVNGALTVQGATQPPLDLILQNGTTTKLEDVPFAGGKSAEIEPGTYDPLTTFPDGKAVADSTAITLSGGDRVLLVATGDGENEPISLFQLQLTADEVSVARIENVAEPTNFAGVIYLPFVHR